MKHAIVTGATKGIGLGVAKMLLYEGYYVTLTFAHDDAAAKTCNAELAKISPNYEIVKVDQADKSAIKTFTLDMLKRQLDIDCLVCNAGTTLRKSLEDITDDDWENVMQVNLNSNVFIIRNLLPRLKNDSRIILIGSMMGIYPHGTSLAYGVSKAATHALTVNLVKVFGGTGTTVNAIAPGFVETEWQKDKPQEIRNNICRKTAAGRFATVEEIADAVRFCLKNGFVNGSVIEVSGGYCYK